MADTDVDGEPLTVIPATINGDLRILTLNADGSYSYALYTAAQNLAKSIWSRRATPAIRH